MAKKTTEKIDVKALDIFDEPQTLEEALAMIDMVKGGNMVALPVNIPLQETAPELEKIEFTTQQKIEQSIDYQIGCEIFRKHHNLKIKWPEGRKIVDEKNLVIKNSDIKFRWYGKTVGGKEWEMKFKHSGYPILNMIMNGRQVSEVSFAFRSLTAPEGLLEITNDDDILKIDRYLRNQNLRPFATEDLEIPKQKKEKVVFGQGELIAAAPKAPEVEEDDGFVKI